MAEDEEYRTRLRSAGRNDPCPCGSGKKYKKCHLAQDQQAEHAAMLKADSSARAEAAAAAATMPESGHPPAAGHPRPEPRPRTGGVRGARQITPPRKAH